MPDDLPQTLLDAVHYFADLRVCNDQMRKLKWPDGVVACPHCGERRVAESADSKRLQCRDCRKKFSFKVGTIFEDSPLGLDQWFVIAWAVANELRVSSEQLGLAIGVPQATAWRMRERVQCAIEAAGIRQ